ncbi:hypothetical protein, partial [Parablautia muri]
MDVMQKFKNEFFEERKDLLSKNHVYRNHINKFVNYLSLPDVQLSNAPARININIVEECIRYYHNKGELNSRSTMESQLESWILGVNMTRLVPSLREPHIFLPA